MLLTIGTKILLSIEQSSIHQRNAELVIAFVEELELPAGTVNSESRLQFESCGSRYDLGVTCVASQTADGTLRYPLQQLM